MQYRSVAADSGWMHRAECRASDLDFIPTQESRRHAASVTWLCDQCDVRTECLLYALLYRMEGYWGGTDTAQRRKLSVRRNRIKCPVCRSRNVIGIPDTADQLCLACALSWEAPITECSDGHSSAPAVA